MICSACGICLVRPACTELCVEAFWKVIEKDPNELFGIVGVEGLNVTHTSNGYFEVNLDILGDYKFINQLFKSGKCEIRIKGSNFGMSPHISSNLFRASIRKRFFYKREIESSNAATKED
jgi:hypothetical protein